MVETGVTMLTVHRVEEQGPALILWAFFLLCYGADRKARLDDRFLQRKTRCEQTVKSTRVTAISNRLLDWSSRLHAHCAVGALDSSHHHHPPPRSSPDLSALRLYLHLLVDWPGDHEKPTQSPRMKSPVSARHCSWSRLGLW